MADQPRMQINKQFSKEEAESTEMAALRAELETQLQNLKQCSYKEYECTQLSLEGYNFCLRHILQDKNAPYKQCAYVYANTGKHCHLAAAKDNGNYCLEHALKSHLANSKGTNRCQPPPTAEVLLSSLSHYVKKPRARAISSSTQYSEENSFNDEGKVTKSLDPFVDIDIKKQLATASNIHEMCSESESDVEPSTHGAIWHDDDADSSDDDSIDSEHEDLLKHANVYSAEEVTLITRDKLIRLQSLYIDQYRYLQYMLREKRRKYLYALKKEKETNCSISHQLRETPKEQRLYKKLKAYNSYHKKHGEEAICRKRLHERRMKSTETAGTRGPAHKCLFTEGGVKCAEKVLPLAKHCRKHILEDPNQVLFRACGRMCGDIECSTPVEEIFDDATCRLHMDIPLLHSYSQRRKDSESDYEEVADHTAVKMEYDTTPPIHSTPTTSRLATESHTSESEHVKNILNQIKEEMMDSPASLSEMSLMQDESSLNQTSLAEQQVATPVESMKLAEITDETEIPIKEPIHADASKDEPQIQRPRSNASESEDFRGYKPEDIPQIETSVSAGTVQE